MGFLSCSVLDMEHMYEVACFLNVTNSMFGLEEAKEGK